MTCRLLAVSFERPARFGSHWPGTCDSADPRPLSWQRRRVSAVAWSRAAATDNLRSESADQQFPARRFFGAYLA